jgi:hypothetical protein
VRTNTQPAVPPASVNAGPRRRSVAPAGSILAVIALGACGVWLGASDLITDMWMPARDAIDQQPELPILVVLRGALLVMSVWVLSGVAGALLGHLFGAAALVKASLSMLPSIIANPMRRALGIGVAGLIATQTLSGGAAFARHSPDVTTQQVVRTQTVSANDADKLNHSIGPKYQFNAATGQQWPIPSDRVSDPDAPVMKPVENPQSRGAGTSLPSPGRRADVVGGVSSVPSASGGALLEPHSEVSPERVNPPTVPRLPTQPAQQPVAPMSPAPKLAAHVVAQGDHFWSIARRTVHARFPDADEAQVGQYARRLIELNRSRLPNPADPNLLLVGTTLELPDLASGR